MCVCVCVNVCVRVCATHVGMRAAGQDVKAVEFVTRHPDALWSMVTLSAAASIGK